MPPKPKENFNAEDASLLENENTTWIITYASIAENQDIRPSNVRPRQINGQAPNSAK
jgi:hypothetical protein